MIKCLNGILEGKKLYEFVVCTVYSVVVAIELENIQFKIDCIVQMDVFNTQFNG